MDQLSPGKGFVSMNGKGKREIAGLILITLLLCARLGLSEVIHQALPLYLYSDFGQIGRHHFYPVGKMGDFQDISLVENCRELPAKGESCIFIRYTPAKESSWAGLYWLYPPNNWGFIPDSGYDLRSAKRFLFYAKGRKGGEKLSFAVGGVNGEYGDTGFVKLDEVVLTSQWQEYAIDLSKSDMSRIIGGFSFSIQHDRNYYGLEFYLDELRYE